MDVNGNAKTMRVFVHLAMGFDAGRWKERWAAGQLVGINEQFPYGYFRAAEDDCTIVYSEDKSENPLAWLIRRGLAFLIGADVIHAWRNRRGIYGSDVVWTHTEQQYLAVLMLFRILFWKPRPKLIAQSVWLFDRWKKLSLMKRWLFSRLIAKADILTVLSPENLKAARSLFPNVRSEFVPFGINTDKFGPLKKEKIHHPVRLLSLGNDPDRDWQVLIRAVKDMPNCRLTIVSRVLNKNAVSSYPNIEVLRMDSNAQLLYYFDCTDILVLPLTKNLHASGITVLEESAIRGVPVICSDTGGLKAYFSDDEVYFIPPGDPSEIRKAIAKLAADDDFRWGLAERAQARMKSGALSSRAYARRHAEISRELLNAR